MIVFHPYDERGMHMKDSNRTRKRIVALLLSQNGRVTSGENDSLLRWIFEKISRGDYSHERVGDLKQTLIAMARDDIISLEHAERKSIRITAVELSAGAETNHIDEEDFDFFRESDSTAPLWLLIGSLQWRLRLLEQVNQRLEQAKNDNEVAFNELVSDLAEESSHVYRERIAELEAAIGGLNARTRELEKENDAIKKHNKMTIESLKDSHKKIVDDISHKFEEYRKRTNRDKSIYGQKVENLMRQLKKCRCEAVTSSSESDLSAAAQ